MKEIDDTPVASVVPEVAGVKLLLETAAAEREAGAPARESNGGREGGGIDVGLLAIDGPEIEEAERTSAEETAAEQYIPSSQPVTTAASKPSSADKSFRDTSQRDSDRESQKEKAAAISQASSSFMPFAFPKDPSMLYKYQKYQTVAEKDNSLEVLLNADR